MQIARTKLDAFLAKTAGKIFTADFVKKDGTVRSLNCRKGVNQFLKGGTNKVVQASNDYITVYDMQKRGYRTLNLGSVLAVRFQGNAYSIGD